MNQVSTVYMIAGRVMAFDLIERYLFFVGGETVDSFVGTERDRESGCLHVEIKNYERYPKVEQLYYTQTLHVCHILPTLTPRNTPIDRHIIYIIYTIHGAFGILYEWLPCFATQALIDTHLATS